MNNEKIPYKIYLTENEMPKAWYNLRADMQQKPAPVVTLELVIDLCGCAELFLQTVGADKRRRTVHLIEIADLLRNFEVRRPEDPGRTSGYYGKPRLRYFRGGGDGDIQ